MPRPQTKKYAEVTRRSVTNLVACSDSVAKERGYIRASNEIQIGDFYSKIRNAYIRIVKVIDEETGEEKDVELVFPVPVD